MNARLALFAITAMLLGAGCSDTRKRWLREETAGLNELADTMDSVNDPASYEQAKPKLKSLGDARRRGRERLFGGVPAARRKEVWEGMKASPDYPKYEEAARRFALERSRLAKLRGVASLLEGELNFPPLDPGEN
jgi:hypothetical protein